MSETCVLRDVAIQDRGSSSHHAGDDVEPTRRHCEQQMQRAHRERSVSDMRVLTAAIVLLGGAVATVTWPAGERNLEGPLQGQPWLYLTALVG